MTENETRINNTGDCPNCGEHIGTMSASVAAHKCQNKLLEHVTEAVEMVAGFGLGTQAHARAITVAKAAIEAMQSNKHSGVGNLLDQNYKPPQTDDAAKALHPTKPTD